MPRLPRITGSQLLRALQNAGFEITRRRGSHIQVRRQEPDGTVTTFPVPVHAGKTIKTGTLRGILRKSGIDAKKLTDLL